MEIDPDETEELFIETMKGFKFMINIDELKLQKNEKKLDEKKLLSQ
jgi:hypothetical protein